MSDGKFLLILQQVFNIGVGAILYSFDWRIGTAFGLYCAWIMIQVYYVGKAKKEEMDAIFEAIENGDAEVHRYPIDKDDYPRQ